MATQGAGSVTLRPVTPEDEPFLMVVYGSTRLEELAMVPWSDEQRAAFIKMQFLAQTQHYNATYPEGEHHIILLDDQPVGRLYKTVLADEIRIIDITVLPRYRNRRIGTPLIRDVMEQGANTAKPVRIFVESFNPSMRLFERLGFARSYTSGAHVLMEWHPGGGVQSDQA